MPFSLTNSYYLKFFSIFLFNLAHRCLSPNGETDLNKYPVLRGFASIASLQVFILSTPAIKNRASIEPLFVIRSKKMVMPSRASANASLHPKRSNSLRFTSASIRCNLISLDNTLYVIRHCLLLNGNDFISSHRASSSLLFTICPIACCSSHDVV